MFSLDPELVIRIEEDRPPEIYLEEGLPRPDRHFLLGIAQSVLVAVEEMDPESVELMSTCTIKLYRANEINVFGSGLLIVRVSDGRFGALIVGDSRLGSSFGSAGRALVHRHHPARHSVENKDRPAIQGTGSGIRELIYL